MAENNRLTEKERNHDGTGISKQSLVVEHGMKKGMPSAYCGAIVTKLADYEDISPVEECREAMEKQTTMDWDAKHDECICPRCATLNPTWEKRAKTVKHDKVYCWHCGQAIEIVN